MKKGIILIAVIIVCLGFNRLRANTVDDFRYDKDVLLEEFSDLNRLEQSVIDNGFLTFTEMQNQDLIPAQFSDLNLTHSMMMDPALGIPGFWWGCIFGPIGILAVYIISEKDEVETKRALTGCLVAGGAELLISVAYFILFFSYYGYSGM